MTTVPQFSRSVSRPAFTLVELLIVIGIIALLISLAVIGFRVVGTASRNRVTITALENGKSMLAEFKKTVPLERFYETAPVISPKPKRWISTSTGIDDALSCRVDAARPGTLDERYLRDETARVINRLRAVPENRQSLEKMSVDRVMAQKFPTDITAILAIPSAEYANGVSTVLLLDGGGHPIYFIPGGGLFAVNLEYKKNGLPEESSSYERPSQTVRAPDNQPFWASAGPDGDLTTGDDNQYSFEQ